MIEDSEISWTMNKREEPMNKRKRERERDRE